MTHRKATGALIDRVTHYPDLLPKMPRYCCPLELFLIEIGLKFRSACQDRQAGQSAVKCFLKDTTE